MIDSAVIEYLTSGQAWLLVGSGPSIAMGYPTWDKLATIAYEAVITEKIGVDKSTMKSALDSKDFPKVFQGVKEILGGARLRQILGESLKPTRAGRVYELIARWPVAVYMTTNFDDETHNHLAGIGVAYNTYSNSEDNMSMLVPDFDGAIVKLHGDLNSEEGLILTSKQYEDICDHEKWQYWRTKMTSVFQMNKVIIIGHSLSDKNIVHVLEAAKKGSGVVQPVCWIAPDVKRKDCDELFNKFRIRVIPYDNSDGEHRNLTRMIESINDFIPPRTVIHVRQQIKEVMESPLEENAGAPGFFVFNKLFGLEELEEKRIEVVLAAIQSAIPKLKTIGEFSIDQALGLVGWPKNLSLEVGFEDFQNKLAEKAVNEGIFIKRGSNFSIGEKAEIISSENRKQFEHLKKRFRDSIILRLKRDFTSLKEGQVTELASGIEASLIGYFRDFGLTLATALITVQSEEQPKLPSSIIRFINQASANYDNWLMRQAFEKVSIDLFLRAESAERQYLGRISQGFFVFHALGVFGPVAEERMKQAKETVWLVDSNVQIYSVALGDPNYRIFRECFTRLKEIGLRLFTTRKLFLETMEHLGFAEMIVREYGQNSPRIAAAARGEGGFKSPNQFLLGFIRWQRAGNPCDWQRYLSEMFGTHSIKEEHVAMALNKIGLEIVDIVGWPGFIETDYSEVEEHTKQIIEAYGEAYGEMFKVNQMEEEQLFDPYKKAQPEGEALVIVVREREGIYYIISEKGYKSPAWFISRTSILNTIEKGQKITWQPESFLRFTSTFCNVKGKDAANLSFDAIALNIAESGITLLDDDTISYVFGGVIDQEKINIMKEREIYERNLADKYGESLESVLQRVVPSNRQMAAIQLAYEMAQAEAVKREHAEKEASELKESAGRAEKKSRGLERFRLKYLRKQSTKRKSTKKSKQTGSKSKGSK